MLSKRTWNIILFVVIFSVWTVAIFYGLKWIGEGLLGGGHAKINAPDSVEPGTPIQIIYEVSVWGSDNTTIYGRYVDLLLHYRLEGESTYTSITPENIPLPEHLAANEDFAKIYEHYRFTIPPFPADTEREIEYYITKTFDGYHSTSTPQANIRIGNLIEENSSPATSTLCTTTSC